MRVILLGAPGVGKGTQAEVISKRLMIPTISTGQIIRDALKSGTELGKKAQSFIEEGKLVEDKVVIGIIKERLADTDCRDGFILDGFPRTIQQAEALDKMGIKIDKVIYLEARDDKIFERLSGRRVCENCGATYHINNRRPKKQGVCDHCAGALKQRRDDRPETISERLKVFREETEPLRNYYDMRGKLAHIDSGKERNEVTEAIIRAIEE